MVHSIFKQLLTLNQLICQHLLSDERESKEIIAEIIPILRIIGGRPNENKGDISFVKREKETRTFYQNYKVERSDFYNKFVYWPIL